MPTARESFGQQSALESTILSGIESLSENQTITFQRYSKVILEQDGYVFWVATSQYMKSKGSFHYSTDRYQDEDQTIGANHVIFTSEMPINEFNEINPETMFIGSWEVPEAPPLRVAFARRDDYYFEENIWHYRGFAVYPALQTQIIENAANLPNEPIVSNSLPIWLSQTTFGQYTVPVYPSFLVPDNVQPPYVVVHIDPEKTEPLGMAPIIGPWPGTVVPDSGASPFNTIPAYQISSDEIRITMYGFNNSMAWQYLAALEGASINNALAAGFMTTPIVRDAKRTQVEITTIAQKKYIEFRASYYQGAADAIARRLILEAGGHWSIPGVPQATGSITFSATGDLTIL